MIITPTISPAVMKGCQRFSNSRWARPVRWGGSEAMGVERFSSRRASSATTATSSATSNQEEIPSE